MFSCHTVVPFTPNWDDFSKKIDYGVLEEDLQAQAGQFFSEAKESLHPSFSAVVTETSDFQKEDDSCSVTILGNRFQGKVLSHLEGIRTVIPYIATSGKGIEQMEQGDYDSWFFDFWRDSMKVLALETARKACSSFFKDFLHTQTLSSVNPGSGPEQLWPIAQLGMLFHSIETFDRVDASMVRDAYMLPNKTVCGVFFSTDRPYFTCSDCQRANCPNRKADYHPKDIV